MLELKNIVKDYVTGDTTVRALKGVDVTFRRSEFVSVLGPSGCGKTTLLNIVGGLDSYTCGDLIINGRSTRDFKAYDWDAYRNNCIGFVFQNYNLIPHLSVLGNVELALTLSGKSKSERRAKAAAALEKVGLGKQMNKRPNQLSGGQMQPRNYSRRRAYGRARQQKQRSDSRPIKRNQPRPTYYYGYAQRRFGGRIFHPYNQIP